MVRVYVVRSPRIGSCVDFAGLRSLEFQFTFCKISLLSAHKSKADIVALCSNRVLS
jgi:hypothetical protein